jgi:hypothetical protein
LHPIKHFRTITKHRHKVISHCFKAGLGFRGLLHDLSKYSPAEFIPGAKYYNGKRSPNVTERELFGYSSAWMHHKGRNKHHFEYWTDFDIKKQQVCPVKMPLRYAAEMFCDRVAASKIYRGENYTDDYPLEYYMRGIDSRTMHPETAAFLEFLLKMLAQKGEQKTFAYLKGIVKAKKEY